MNCSICNKRIRYSKNWDRHINSKAHIKKALLQNNNNQITSNNTQNNTQTPINNIQNTQNNTQNTQNNIQQQPERKYYGECKYCNKSYMTQQSLSKHQKDRCKMRPQEGTTIINNTTNNITNNNNTQIIHQHVHIHVHGQENLTGCLTLESIGRLVNMATGSKMLIHVGDQVFKREENKSIAYPNYKNKFCQVKRIEGIQDEYLSPVLKDVIDRIPEITKTELLKEIKIARANGHYDTSKTHKAIDDKRLVTHVYKKMKEACKDATERKEVEYHLKALFHNNKLL